MYCDIFLVCRRCFLKFQTTSALELRKLLKLLPDVSSICFKTHIFVQTFPQTTIKKYNLLSGQERHYDSTQRGC